MKRKTFTFMILFVFIMTNFAILSYGQAKDGESYKKNEATEITHNETLKIAMGQLLLKVSVNPTNVFVLDQNQKSVAINVSMDSTGKYVLVKPKRAYTVGGSYVLYVSKNIFFQTGKHPSQGVKQPFVVKKTPTLSVVGSLDKLKELLEDASAYTGGMEDRFAITTSVEKAAADGSAAKAAGAAPTTDQLTSSDYSKTNVQVEGVDEADIVKTDGQYIYTANGKKLYVVKAVPGNKMELISTIGFENASFSPSELYVDASINRLVVIGQAISPDPKVVPYGRYQTTRAIVYDIADRSDIKKLREFELEGNYLSSRKIGSKLYLVTNKPIYSYRMNSKDELNLLPSYRDTAKSNQYINVDCSEIRYFPDTIQSSYLMIGVLDINKSEKAASVSTYLGAGSNIYMSENSLYVAVTRYDFGELSQPQQVAPKTSAVAVQRFWWPGNQNVNTLVYRFKVSEDSVDYAASGEVPGVILNQFSMDENNNTFRIATTKGEVWTTGENLSKNNLYVLDQDMKICGSLTDMAPGEKIYSVRFMGDRAYVVTFKKVDPLFVIDLKDKTNPKILGALKIPGYSDYLHPYDETHIIGFGKDSVEIPFKDYSGKVAGTNAYYLGMKVALFDVSDVVNPKEISHEIIGDRGTWSPLLSDHKALMFSKEKNLMVFPVTEFTLKQGMKAINDQGYPEYGAFSYQGAYVYRIDAASGFTLKGRITHLSDEEYKKVGDYNFDNSKFINRALYIGDTLYTSSNQMIKANTLTGLGEIGSITMK